MPQDLNSAGSPDLTSYKVLSFDVFGTLLDWERGMLPCLQPVLSRLPADSPFRQPLSPQHLNSGSGSDGAAATGEDVPLAAKHPAFVAFDAHEARLMAELPGADYRTLLGFALRDLGTQLLGAAEAAAAVDAAAMAAAGASVGRWPAFADTIDALARLARHYRLVALSNVSNDAIADVLGPGGGLARDAGTAAAGAETTAAAAGTTAEMGAGRWPGFDAVYTAQDIGSYKPALDNFEYLLANAARDFGLDLGPGPGLGSAGGGGDGGCCRLLHVAHGVPSDQLPAEALGIDHVWVARGVDNWPPNERGAMRRLRVVADLRQLADQADAAFAAQAAAAARTNGTS